MLRSALILTAIRGLGAMRLKPLIDIVGSPEALLNESEQVLNTSTAGRLILEGRRNRDVLNRVEKELQFINDHHISAYIYGTPGYPMRLAECPDAPLILMQLGNLNLDSPHIIGIVGTRSCTQYGRDLTRQFVNDLKQLVPDVVVISGLALGIDITAHRAALECNAPTAAVLAHGLDRIYPAVHRNEARNMVLSGGALLTEYLTQSEPERGHFLSRNRIIAGLSDAVLVAESKNHGGSLVTASIASSYARDVFAFPGRVGDIHSAGCLQLVVHQRAGLITSAAEFAKQMLWAEESNKQESQQTILQFDEPDITPLGRQILDILRQEGDLRAVQLSDRIGADLHTITAELLSLEVDDYIRSIPGGIYQVR